MFAVVIERRLLTTFDVFGVAILAWDVSSPDARETLFENCTLFYDDSLLRFLNWFMK